MFLDTEHPRPNCPLERQWLDLSNPFFPLLCWQCLCHTYLIIPRCVLTKVQMAWLVYSGVLTCYGAVEHAAQLPAHLSGPWLPQQQKVRHGGWTWEGREQSHCIIVCAQLGQPMHTHRPAHTYAAFLSGTFLQKWIDWIRKHQVCKKSQKSSYPKLSVFRVGKWDPERLNDFFKATQLIWGNVISCLPYFQASCQALVMF
jgi:hypothetical protein